MCVPRLLPGSCIELCLAAIWPRLAKPADVSHLEFNFGHLEAVAIHQDVVESYINFIFTYLQHRKGFIPVLGTEPSVSRQTLWSIGSDLRLACACRYEARPSKDWTGPNIG